MVLHENARIDAGYYFLTGGSIIPDAFSPLTINTHNFDDGGTIHVISGASLTINCSGAFVLLPFSEIIVDAGGSLFINADTITLQGSVVSSGYASFTATQIWIEGDVINTGAAPMGLVVPAIPSTATIDSSMWINEHGIVTTKPNLNVTTALGYAASDADMVPDVTGTPATPPSPDPENVGGQMVFAGPVEMGGTSSMTVAEGAELLCEDQVELFGSLTVENATVEIGGNFTLEGATASVTTTSVASAAAGMSVAGILEADLTSSLGVGSIDSSHRTFLQVTGAVDLDGELNGVDAHITVGAGMEIWGNGSLSLSKDDLGSILDVAGSVLVHTPSSIAIAQSEVTIGGDFDTYIEVLNLCSLSITDSRIFVIGYFDMCPDLTVSLEVGAIQVGGNLAQTGGTITLGIAYHGEPYILVEGTYFQANGMLVLEQSSVTAGMGLIISGTLNSFGGSVEGDLENYGSVLAQNGLWITGDYHQEGGTLECLTGNATSLNVYGAVTIGEGSTLTVLEDPFYEGSPGPFTMISCLSGSGEFENLSLPSGTDWEWGWFDTLVGYWFFSIWGV